MKIFIIRHGETEWNVLRKMQGQQNSPLTPLGKNQAAWVGDYFKTTKFDLIYTSDLQRAKETAQIIASHNDYNTTPITETELLREISLGEWEGLVIESVKTTQPEAFDAFWNNPEKDQRKTGESFTKVIERAKKFIDSLKDSNYSQILVVTHTITLKAILAYIENKALSDFWSGGHTIPASITEIEFVNENFKVNRVGCSSHHKNIK